MKSTTEHNQTPNSYRPHCISFLGYPINFGVLPKINENYKIINKFELTETKWLTQKWKFYLQTSDHIFLWVLI